MNIFVARIDILNRLIQWVEVLRTKDDLEQIKTKVMFEIISSLEVSHFTISNFKEVQFE